VENHAKKNGNPNLTQQPLLADNNKKAMKIN